MTPEDRPRFAGAIGALAEAYRQTISTATIKAYEMGLDDLSIDQIEHAVRKAMRTCKFFPAPIELRELAGELSGSNRAIVAWEEFERAVVRHGGYRSVRFTDPILTATIRNLGGWQRCCEMDPEEFDKWLRKDFLAAYQALEASGVGQEAALHLPGIIEQQNALLGKYHESQEAVEVGARTCPLPGPSESHRSLEHKPGRSMDRVFLRAVSP